VRMGMPGDGPCTARSTQHTACIISGSWL
jgi:hypothetical protein